MSMTSQSTTDRSSVSSKSNEDEEEGVEEEVEEGVEEEGEESVEEKAMDEECVADNAEAEVDNEEEERSSEEAEVAEQMETDGVNSMDTSETSISGDLTAGRVAPAQDDPAPTVVASLNSGRVAGVDVAELLDDDQDPTPPRTPHIGDDEVFVKSPSPLHHNVSGIAFARITPSRQIIVQPQQSIVSRRASATIM